MSYFGLLNTDIVNSFSQAISSDFAVGGVDGYTIIDREISFQYEKLMSYLSDQSLKMMDKINGEIAVVNLSGGFSPSLYAVEGSLRGYIVYKGWTPCAGQSLEYNGGSSSCWENQLDQNISVSTANISALGLNSYQILDVFNYKTQNLVLYYDVDNALLEMSSLKTLLRDMVCASLGSRIYPAADADKWSIVKYYLDEANKMIDLLKDGWMPAEFKKIKLINGTPRKGSLTSVRINRT